MCEVPLSPFLTSTRTGSAAERKIQAIRSKSGALKYRVLVIKVQFMCGDVKLMNEKGVLKQLKTKALSIANAV